MNVTDVSEDHSSSKFKQFRKTGLLELEGEVYRHFDEYQYVV